MQSRVGEPILENSGLIYSDCMPENVGLTHDIVIQFISNIQLATYRAIVETWKQLKTYGDDRVVNNDKIFHRIPEE